MAQLSGGGFNMSAEQIILALNGAAYLVLWFFVRMWINDIKSSIETLDSASCTFDEKPI